jgi:uncharacterized membrane protein
VEYFRTNIANSTFYYALLAIMTALTTVATMVFQIPFVATQGYFNLGDTFVMTSGFLLGPIGGFIAGGTGSALADLFLAYPAYAPITFVAKGFEGLLVGLFSFHTKQATRISGWDIIGILFGSIAMLLGYFLGEAFLLGYGVEAALAELITINLLQVTAGAIVAIFVGPIVRMFLRTMIYGPPELPEPETEMFETYDTIENQP